MIHYIIGYCKVLLCRNRKHCLPDPDPIKRNSNEEADDENRMEKDPFPAALPGAAGGTVPRRPGGGETCTLTFSVDGGNYLDPITAEQGTEITLPKAVWNNHYFLGWSLSSGGDVKYQAGETLVLTEETKLYAIWRDS